MKTIRTQVFDYKKKGFSMVDIEYSVNPTGSKSLYNVVSITRRPDRVKLDPVIVSDWHPPEEMDMMIAAADPVQVEFARRELGVDLKDEARKRHKAGPKKAVKRGDHKQPEPEEEEDLF